MLASLNAVEGARIEPYLRSKLSKRGFTPKRSQPISKGLQENIHPAPSVFMWHI